jgi:hypothetical protein
MSAATAVRDMKRKESDVVSYGMGIIKIWKGTLVSLRTDGYIYPSRSGTSTDIFVGVAYETKDNTAGAAGDKALRVHKVGTFSFVKATPAVTDNGVLFYASDDSTLTATSTNNQAVGVGVYDSDLPSGLLRVRIDNSVK